MNDGGRDAGARGSPAQCALCARKLPNGSLRYIAEVSVTADFDPLLVFPDDLDGQIEHTLQAMQEAAEEGLGGKLSEQVIARRAFLLCPACREQWLAKLPGELQ